MQIELILDKPDYTDAQNYYLVPVRFTPDGARTGEPRTPNPWRAVAVDFEEALCLVDHLRDGTEVAVKVLSPAPEVRLGIARTFPRRSDLLVNIETGEQRPVSAADGK